MINLRFERLTLPYTIRPNHQRVNPFYAEVDSFQQLGQEYPRGRFLFDAFDNLDPVQGHVVQEYFVQQVAGVRHGADLLRNVDWQIVRPHAVLRNYHAPGQVISVGLAAQVDSALVRADVGAVSDDDEGVQGRAFRQP
jgi:hypothetical protein